MYVIMFDGIGQAFYKMFSHPSFKNLKKNPKLRSSTESSKLPVLKYDILNC